MRVSINPNVDELVWVDSSVHNPFNAERNLTSRHVYQQACATALAP